MDSTEFNASFMEYFGRSTWEWLPGDIETLMTSALTMTVVDFRTACGEFMRGHRQHWRPSTGAIAAHLDRWQKARGGDDEIPSTLSAYFDGLPLAFKQLLAAYEDCSTCYLRLRDPRSGVPERLRIYGAACHREGPESGYGLILTDYIGSGRKWLLRPHQVGLFEKVEGIPPERQRENLLRDGAKWEELPAILSGSRKAPKPNAAPAKQQEPELARVTIAAVTTEVDF